MDALTALAVIHLNDDRVAEALQVRCLPPPLSPKRTAAAPSARFPARLRNLRRFRPAPPPSPHDLGPTLQLLKRAYELEPSHPATLNQLANHYFYKAQHAKAQARAPATPLPPSPPARPHPRWRASGPLLSPLKSFSTSATCAPRHPRRVVR